MPVNTRFKSADGVVSVILRAIQVFNSHVLIAMF
jgi:hypothetical protein